MLKKTKYWVIAANSGSAEIFAVEPGKSIELIQQINFPEGRMKGREILSDRPGRSFDKMGSARHALGTKTSLHTHEQQVFAHELCTLLRKGCEEQLFERLVMIAPPEFLGDLRKILPENVKRFLFQEINKEIPNFLSEIERKELICKYLDVKMPEAPRLRKG